MLQEFQKNNIVITDTSCLILLDKIDGFSILNQLFENIITTPEIAGEYGDSLPDWIKIKPASNKSVQQLYAEKVDLGEASAIALALETDSALLVIDDLKGRHLAADLNLNYIGTLGILLLAKVITQLKPYFEKIRNTNFRIAPALLDQLLRQAGE